MPNRWDQVGKLFDAVRDLPPGEREDYLAAHCDEEAVREEVRSLLGASEEATDFFDQLAGAVPSPGAEGATGGGEENGTETGGPGGRGDDPLDLEGERVEQYAVEAHVGGGGMGVVYRARDTQLGRCVALKFLPPRLAESEEARRRFVREARSAATLDHPHIARIYEIRRSAGGRRFIAMPHYDGKPLSDVVDRGPLPVAHAVRFSRQMAGALAEAHDAGIIHRDVKPANVMITEGSAVKLLDFGIARVLAETRLTEPGRRMGTAAYMSPEQVTGDPVTPATDVWALGVVLYEMLAGVRPFGGDSRLALYRAIVHDAPTSIADRRADVPPLLQAILGRCLQKPRADRYADARAVEEDLEDVPV